MYHLADPYFHRLGRKGAWSLDSGRPSLVGSRVVPSRPDRATPSDGGLVGARGLAIRDDLSADELRRLARREVDRAAAARMYAIAHALGGMSRAISARLAGMERQALHDAVVRYNAEGVAGLHNRRAPPQPGKLDATELRDCRRPSCAAPTPRLTDCRPGRCRTCAG
jgi:hypothetical protein